jgi:hypothetical protein
MIATRQSGAHQRNTKVRAVQHAGSNRQWLAALPDDVVMPGAVVLLGGSNVVDFRVRVAQAHLRHDLLPSFWSHVGIVVSKSSFLSVPLDIRLDPTRVPSTNGIAETAFADYDDPISHPNIAVINFAAHAATVVGYAQGLHRQRSAVDLPQLLVAWLAFAWGAGDIGNPLLKQLGVPAAAFVETAFGIGGIEITPGVASAGSCPEAIWQSAIWWHEYYEKTAGAFSIAATREGSDTVPTSIVPTGAYFTRQPAAAVVDELS